MRGSFLMEGVEFMDFGKENMGFRDEGGCISGWGLEREDAVRLALKRHGGAAVKVPPFLFDIARETDRDFCGCEIFGSSAFMEAGETKWKKYPNKVPKDPVTGCPLEVASCSCYAEGGRLFLGWLQKTGKDVAIKAGHPELSDDATSVFLDLFLRRLPSYSSSFSLEYFVHSFVIPSAVATVIDDVQKNKLSCEVCGSTDSDTAIPVPNISDIERVLAEALASVDPIKAETYLLHFDGNLSLTEIAGRLGMSVGFVHGALHSTCKTVVKYLSAYFGNEVDFRCFPAFSEVAS